MGKSLNKAQIIGTLGRDPEMRYLPNGNAVATISVATDESYNDKQTGQKIERTEWHRLTCFGKLAEIIGQYLKKGSKAYFDGKLRTNEYEKDGIKRYSTEIVVSEMMMLDGKQDNQQPGGFQQQQAQPQQQQGQYQQQQQGYGHTRVAYNANQPQQQGGFQQQQNFNQPQR